MSARHHALFKRFPLTSTAQLSVGIVPVPYHIYDGSGIFVGGTADLSAVTDLLRTEQLTPLRTTDDRALMGIWICDFVDASLDPHHELQFSIFVSSGASAPIPAHPVGLLSAMLTHPDLQMLCHGLWNNTPKVVAYNRELLSLNARSTTSQIVHTTTSASFSFADSSTGQALLHGQLAVPSRTSPALTRALLSQMGFLRTLQVTWQPAVRMQVVNPLGVGLKHNGIAEAYTKNATNIIREFDASTDLLTISALPYANLGFRPQIIQFMTGFKFVYLNPR